MFGLCMVIKKAIRNTDQVSRSLLQKAIRRGCQDVAAATFWHLSNDKEEFRWVKARLAVLTFEEAWPYGEIVNFNKSRIENLRHIMALCSVRKNKDAAGMGSLAYALSQGDNSVLENDKDDWYIRVVAKALKEKEKFLMWAQSESTLVSAKQTLLVKRAIEGSKKASWPWDKAFTYAAALLAIKHPVPELYKCPTLPADEFPFWIAIDKHTQKGKEVIRQVANELHIPVEIAFCISFYFGGGKCSEITPGPWWERERSWSLSRLRISEADAEILWLKISSLLKKYLEKDAMDLKSRIMQSSQEVPLALLHGHTTRQEQKELF